MSGQTPWQEHRNQRAAPYARGRHAVPPPAYEPPVTAVPYTPPRRRVHPMVIVGIVLGGAALLCVGTVRVLVGGGDPQGTTALPTAEASTDPAETAEAVAADPSLAPPASSAPPATTAPPPATTAPPPSAKPRVTTRPPATTRPAPLQPTPSPSTTTSEPASNCDPSYPTVCIPPAPPDLDCGDIPYRNFEVLPPDPHRFDTNDKDNIGCESP